MNWMNYLNGDPLPWLLEADSANPSVRYFALRDLAGAEFLLSRDPAVADYPYTARVSSTWFKFGFPLSYWSDVLEVAAVLVEAGHGSDPGLSHALQNILDKQDAQGRWKLENSLNGKMWVDIEQKGKPSKWVTLREMRLLKLVQSSLDNYYLPSR